MSYTSKFVRMECESTATVLANKWGLMRPQWDSLRRAQYQPKKEGV